MYVVVSGGIAMPPDGCVPRPDEVDDDSLRGCCGNTAEEFGGIGEDLSMVTGAGVITAF